MGASSRRFRVDPSFVVIVAILSIAVAAGSSGMFEAWHVAIALTVVVLIHELGHVLVASALGTRPSIVLSGFHGLTISEHGGWIGRWHQVALFAVGPVLGLMTSLAVLALQVYPFGDVAIITWHVGILGLWINIYNLLPLPGQDGHGILLGLLNESAWTMPARMRLRRLLTALGLLLAAVAWALGWPVVAIMVAAGSVPGLQTLLGDPYADMAGAADEAVYRGDLTGLSRLIERCDRTKQPLLRRSMQIKLCEGHLLQGDLQGAVSALAPLGEMAPRHLEDALAIHRDPDAGWSRIVLEVAGEGSGPLPTSIRDRRTAVAALMPRLGSLTPARHGELVWLAMLARDWEVVELLGTRLWEQVRAGRAAMCLARAAAERGRTAEAAEWLDLAGRSGEKAAIERALNPVYAGVPA